MDLPLKPQIRWKNLGVPLHPGAEKYYREKVWFIDAGCAWLAPALYKHRS